MRRLPAGQVIASVAVFPLSRPWRERCKQLCKRGETSPPYVPVLILQLERTSGYRTRILQRLGQCRSEQSNLSVWPRLCVAEGQLSYERSFCAAKTPSPTRTTRIKSFFILSTPLEDLAGELVLPAELARCPS